MGVVKHSEIREEDFRKIYQDLKNALETEGVVSKGPAARGGSQLVRINPALDGIIKINAVLMKFEAVVEDIQLELDL